MPFAKTRLRNFFNALFSRRYAGRMQPTDDFYGLEIFVGRHQWCAVVRFFIAKKVQDFLCKMIQNESRDGASEPMRCIG